MNLKDNIIEHFDYEAVGSAVWKHLYSWYSADWCIMRYLKRDKVTRKGLMLDLYPENSAYSSFVEDDEDDSKAN